MDREAAPRLDRSSFVERDAADPLGPQRRRFALPESVLYFDGNSLGPLPRSVPEALGRTAEREWGQDLIASWNAHGWIDLPARVGAKLAPLIGASPGEVLACDSVSVNLFKLLAAALGIQGPGRPVVVVQDDHFPTDLYIAQGLSSLIEERCEVRRASIDRLPEALDERVAAVCLSHVDFRTGRLEDMATLTEQIQRAGALAVWDLSHSAGALPVRLGECGVDMAVGCGYKFLCGGPGAPAFLHVAERHHQTARSPLWGWLGHRDPFAFESDYSPAEGPRRFLCGTPPILSMAALDAALDLWRGDVDLERVRAKSVALGDALIRCVRERCPALELVSPPGGARRGSQVTFRHPRGYALVQALIARGVIGDFRAPDLMRFGLHPLTLRYVDAWDAVSALAEVLESGEYLEPRFERRQTVT